jgi:hypothetical protein
MQNSADFFGVVTTEARQKKNLRNFAYKTLTHFLRVICAEFLQELLVNGEASCDMLFHAPHKKQQGFLHFCSCRDALDEIVDLIGTVVLRLFV